ncbi:MAG: hypothetical protein ACTSPG_07840 [Candidatus Hodarchaeales archaeon]
MTETTKDYEILKFIFTLVSAIWVTDIIILPEMLINSFSPYLIVYSIIFISYSFSISLAWFYNKLNYPKLYFLIYFCLLFMIGYMSFNLESFGVRYPYDLGSFHYWSFIEIERFKQSFILTLITFLASFLNMLFTVIYPPLGDEITLQDEDLL